MTASGSRYLKEPFAAHEERMQATEKIMDLQFSQVEQRLGKIENMIERLERRLWMAVYGVVAVILTQAVLSLIEVGPK
ncbi:MAG: hypothetical protein EP320_09065 [Rhodobacteraceae bacterium]|jgi:hypothetical protein|uniref:Gene transfer agent protein n=1 Tax=Thioclava marina TaxID=1915077 RepID=A0ABX3MRE8_9RHOB|nr:MULTISPECIES: hypothetical protein [Thioclava]TNE83625.1 MAG: hypothetical protein EP337_15560 [Paracoccaceae bacterium]MBD3804499.1 hypothetical protein [Thioclava sp.]OOY12618.1 hypothetical protein BMG00_01850 [Thioclava marina]OOY28635.1 hypothetical protein BMI90_08245 [Thioclava sp. L04-15]TNF13521.1 MAG: hypothetical protein EP320_09065 [Paracoccaceae bacterium]